MDLFKEKMINALQNTIVEERKLIRETEPTMMSICPFNTFELKEKLTNVALIEHMQMLNEVYRGRRVKHKTGSIYFITGATVIHKDSKSWWGLEYSPFINGTIVLEVRHTRTLDEFTDGRFTLV